MKKRGPVAIVIAVLVSILLFPFIYAGGLCTGALMATGSLFKPVRKTEIYHNFVADHGIDWIYEAIDGAIAEEILEASDGMEDIEGMEQIFENLVTKEDVEKIVEELYYTVMDGEIYQFDLSVFSDRLMVNLEEFVDVNAPAYIEEKLADIYEMAGDDVKAEVKAVAKKIYMEEAQKGIEAQLADVSPELKDAIRAELLAEVERNFDGQADAYIAENLDTLYAQLDEETKNKLIAEAKKVILPEFQSMVAEEVETLEESINTEFANIYASPEFEEFTAIQEQYGVNIFDFEFIYASVRTVSYVFLAVTFVFVLLLLLSHLFRPSGFYVAGVYSVLLGAIEYVFGSVFGGRVADMVNAELAPPHQSLETLVANFLKWFGEGFTSAGLIFLGAGAALILCGILIGIINKNKMVQEA